MAESPVTRQFRITVATQFKWRSPLISRTAAVVGPIFNTQGALTGIVSATQALGEQMVLRLAAPAVAIRGLRGEPLPESVPISQNGP